MDSTDLVSDHVTPDGIVVMMQKDRVPRASDVLIVKGINATRKEWRHALERQAASPVLREVQRRQGQCPDVQNVPRGDQEASNGLEEGEEGA